MRFPSDKAAGLDIDRIQKSYLLTAGLKMVGMATSDGCGNGFCSDCLSSRVAAGIGRDLRDQVSKGCRIFQCGNGSIFHSIPDYEKYK